MAEMIEELDGMLAIAITRRVLGRPIAERSPISALSWLSVSGRIEAPRVQKCVSSCTLDVLAEIVETMGGMPKRVGQRLSAFKLIKGFANNNLKS